MMLVSEPAFLCDLAHTNFNSKKPLSYIKVCQVCLTGIYIYTLMLGIREPALGICLSVLGPASAHGFFFPPPRVLLFLSFILGVH